ncbi:hypothetical protein [Cecembia rubra]|uniref:Uncharacterized protein n=1 Tax=Cecembia rubra TaxID=1485585 RepID=A0A2P8ECN9_9BACT|nr:hypothetical protein [Cecembia rubra]PSL07233.1 hypothetical protein CLV48_101163 [Cecembia rubra]
MDIKFLGIILSLFFILEISGKDIQVVYKYEEPLDKSGMTFYRKTSKDYLDRGDMILRNAEKDLLKIAKEKRANVVEIYVLEKVNGEIPTESQIGRFGFVSLLYVLKKSN